jgi:transcriptional regulator with XRE-family HTH domain
MDGRALEEARRKKKWTQEETACALGVTQAYLSMLEKGRRPVSDTLARKVLKVLDVSPTALPLRSSAVTEPFPSGEHDYGRQLGALGYPGFAYLKKDARRNPAAVLFDSLNESDLDARVAEALPWLALTYLDMDWDWLVRNVKLCDRQNRLGFAVSLASEVAEARHEKNRAQELCKHLAKIERARLAREDTFCHDSMTNAERTWLRKHRPRTAAHWNLLTDLKGEALAYARE